MHGLVKEAHAQLLAISSNKKQYKSLLTDLTVQVSRPQAWVTHSNCINAVRVFYMVASFNTCRCIRIKIIYPACQCFLLHGIFGISGMWSKVHGLRCRMLWCRPSTSLESPKQS